MRDATPTRIVGDLVGALALFSPCSLDSLKLQPVHWGTLLRRLVAHSSWADMKEPGTLMAEEQQLRLRVPESQFNRSGASSLSEATVLVTWRR